MLTAALLSVYVHVCVCACIDMTGVGGRGMMMARSGRGMMGHGGYGPLQGPGPHQMDFYYHQQQQPYGMDSYYSGGGQRPPYGERERERLMDYYTFCYNTLSLVWFKSTPIWI